MISGTFRLSGLWPPMAEAVRYLLAWCEYFGYSVEITSGFRSNAEQAQLVLIGRTQDEVQRHVLKRGANGAVTDAWPGESAHNYGLAVDISGKDRPLVMALAKRIGFGTVSWDPDHLEWPNWKMLIH